MWSGTKNPMVFLLLVGAMTAAVSLLMASKQSQPPPVMHLCDVLKETQQYDGKQITVRATYRSGVETSQLFCLACIDRGRVWMRELLPRDGEISSGVKKLNELVYEARPGITVNGIFTGIFRGPGQYGYLGASTYQIEVQEVRDVELIYHGPAEPERLPEEIKKKMCR
jgi:hypothetical protein